jgi:hypothetical protein
LLVPCHALECAALLHVALDQGNLVLN